MSEPLVTNRRAGGLLTLKMETQFEFYFPVQSQKMWLKSKVKDWKYYMSKTVDRGL